MLSESENNHLMPHVLAKLLPDVFYHPLWIYSLPKSTLHSSEVIDKIKPSIQQMIEQGDYRNAAQLLLACAALQKQSGDPNSALETVQNVWAMGLFHKIPEIARWAAWGACSICAGQNEFHLAANHLEQLQVRALEGEDWVLTATIGIVKIFCSTISETRRTSLRYCPGCKAGEILLSSNRSMSLTSSTSQRVCQKSPYPAFLLPGGRF
jgi:hypothetical protein